MVYRIRLNEPNFRGDPFDLFFLAGTQVAVVSEAEDGTTRLEASSNGYRLEILGQGIVLEGDPPSFAAGTVQTLRIYGADGRPVISVNSGWNPGGYDPPIFDADQMNFLFDKARSGDDPGAALRVMLDALDARLQLGVQGLLTGTEEADNLEGVYLFGDDGPQTINAAAGDDLIRPGYGTITYAGQGDDTIRMGYIVSGELFGGPGDDEFHGALQGELTIRGGYGDDLIATLGEVWGFGGPGNDTLAGYEYDDTLTGGDDDDLLTGGDGMDLLFGNSGDDTLIGDSPSAPFYWAEDDVLVGGSGNDLLHGNLGNDLLNGGTGADTLDGDGGNDTLQGGAGDDLLRGGADRDTLSGGTGADRLYGGDGSDIIMSYGAAYFDDVGDTIDGGDGWDIVRGGEGADLIYGRDGRDTLYGRDGDDTIRGGGDDDTVAGGDGDDLLFGGDGADLVYGSWGDDRIDAGTGLDWAAGGSGADVFVFRPGDGRLQVADFDPAVDGLEVSRGLWDGARYGSDVGALLAEVAHDTAGGLVLRFDGGEILTLAGVTDLEAVADSVVLI